MRGGRQQGTRTCNGATSSLVAFACAGTTLRTQPSSSTMWDFLLTYLPHFQTKHDCAKRSTSRPPRDPNVLSLEPLVLQEPRRPQMISDQLWKFVEADVAKVPKKGLFLGLVGLTPVS